MVLAGPGSGKTKTLTVAMARALTEDIAEPHGIACLTYNNECALELELRLARLGVESNDRIFIGTVHSFAVSHVIGPYGRCLGPEFPSDFRVATLPEIRETVERVHRNLFGAFGNPQQRWRFAEAKRLSQVDRTQPEWRGTNIELAEFVEAYERDLRRQGLIDFNDMPLLAARMLMGNPWIAESLRAKFPVLFVDEYQDLGNVLHELVQILCFSTGIRLFAVGDPDQSIYRFQGADPALLQALSQRADIESVVLKLNYRCGTKIIGASATALGRAINYQAPEGSAEGEVIFRGVQGGLSAQAADVCSVLIPSLLAAGIPAQEIAVLYRTAEEGSEVAEALTVAGLPFVRADNQALIPRASRLSRFIEACAYWTSGGWKTAEPPFSRLLHEAILLVFGGRAGSEERLALEIELIAFLQKHVGATITAHAWLRDFQTTLSNQWKYRSRNRAENWESIDKLIANTDIATNLHEISIAMLGGYIADGGRINLSTLHSAKGREFDVAIMFGMNNGSIPSVRDHQSAEALLETRRLFYVGVTRARKQLILCYQNQNNSPWVKEVYDRIQQQ